VQDHLIANAATHLKQNHLVISFLRKALVANFNPIESVESRNAGKGTCMYADS
jgi:hypothetical protein